MITPIPLLNIRPTLRTTFRRLPNNLLRSFLLIFCFPPAQPVFILLASLAFVPWNVMDSAGLEGALVAGEDWVAGVVGMDLAARAERRETPEEVGDFGERGANLEGFISVIED